MSLSSADLFSAAGLESFALDFRAAFLADLRKFGRSTASATRERYGIAGGPQIGAAIRGLQREGLIVTDGTECASGSLSHGRLTRAWKLAPKGGER